MAGQTTASFGIAMAHFSRVARCAYTGGTLLKICLFGHPSAQHSDIELVLYVIFSDSTAPKADGISSARGGSQHMAEYAADHPRASATDSLPVTGPVLHQPCRELPEVSVFYSAVALRNAVLISVAHIHTTSAVLR